MLFIYNLIIRIVYFFIKVIAVFNAKLGLFVSGRKDTFRALESIKTNDKVFWIHAASLGEFEQARPIIEQLKSLYSDYKIVVTFFSPSGYEIRKNYDLADVVCYLPFDTSKNMRRFIHQVHPDLAIIVKYEFWPNLLNELRKTKTKTLLVSGIFRKDQLFFKSYGKWMRNFLSAFNHFFVQNTSSIKLLNQIDFKNVTLSGDTRFDRVYKILNQNNSINFIEEFKNNKYTVVAGSTWKEDEDLLVKYINEVATDEEKFIIAPHKIDPVSIETLRKSILKKTILYSERNNVNLKNYNVFIVNTIGILTKIYSYANIAYVGGGLATGLHNILEPATFGIPIIYGDNKYQKFNEAHELLALGGSKTVKNNKELISTLVELKNNISLRVAMGNICKSYINTNIGATNTIIAYIKQHIQ
ncbi:3-deoxy-D-manno-octulosonic acid transferase [Tenacibaculum sp. SZ-18]|uniref:3-deoxy-D-manno-octulosonic acid transferase n=1 Tax=Tenacibaculum sp. SZ-18 TaxID=754423 RepID=UPI000C2D0377|nr:glycosyltransferase N-terminal domain-containing protein [Tenacibaculum sp. SZ-18]AUC13640.1 3-deoxy-D-manno-octulosonic acid transferase [Tenacibaculum sp. SZ-18]